MKHLPWIIGMGALIFSTTGCSNDEPPPSDDEGTACPADVDNQAQAALNAVAGFESYVARHVEAAVPACATITTGLGGTPPPSSSPAKPSEVGTVCQVARQEVQQASIDQAVFEVSLTEMPCVADQSAQDACKQACGFGDSCDRLCSAQAVYTTICAKPVVVVTANASIKMALEPAIPDVAALQSENDEILAAHSDYGTAVADLLVELTNDELCGAQRDALGEAATAMSTAQNDHSTSASEAANLVAQLPITP